MPARYSAEHELHHDIYRYRCAVHWILNRIMAQFSIIAREGVYPVIGSEVIRGSLRKTGSNDDD